MFIPLSKLSKVNLGFKSLQNLFYYVNQSTIDIYHIEKRFLVPILMNKAMNPHVYWQSSVTDQWLFCCREKMGDLRGTGAQKYIEAMANRSAAEKKQAGKKQTIRQALEDQSGEIWYAPKAQPYEHRIWLRKAIDGVFAPYLFETPTLVDQRCNSICPDDDIDWKELAAILTSTLFAYSLEINGSASMGAGALEAATRKLRGYPVLNIRALSAKDRKTLILLANAVWENESPVNWSDKGAMPSKALQKLDAWLLHKCKCNVSIETVYMDLHTVCLSRISVAQDKAKKTKKHKANSVGKVAESIAKAVSPKLKARNFPDSFTNNAKLDISLNFDHGSLGKITIFPFMDRYDIAIRTKTGEIAYADNLLQPVAETIIRSILWGRSAFSISADCSAMTEALLQFIDWITSINDEIDKLISDSALGTGYENELRVEVFSKLGIHPMVGEKSLPKEILL